MSDALPKTDLTALALTYLDQGFTPIPTGGPGRSVKQPRCAEWQKRLPADYLADPVLLSAFETATGVGLVTHQMMDVIDLDLYKATEGPCVELGKMLTEGKYAGQHCLVRTPRGGLHLWVKPIEGLKSSAGIESHIDVRAEGGMVVAPGVANENGDRYNFLRESDKTHPSIGVCPIEVLELIRPAPAGTELEEHRAERKPAYHIFTPAEREVREAVESYPILSGLLAEYYMYAGLRPGAEDPMKANYWWNRKPAHLGEEIECLFCPKGTTHATDNNVVAYRTAGAIKVKCIRDETGKYAATVKVDYKLLFGRDDAAGFYRVQDLERIAGKCHASRLEKAKTELRSYLHRWFVRTPTGGMEGEFIYYDARTNTFGHVKEMHPVLGLTYVTIPGGDKKDVKIKVTELISNSGFEARLTLNLAKPRFFEEDGIFYVNQFAGFAFAHNDGMTIPPQAEDDLACLLNHLKVTLCSGNQFVYDYYLDLLANLVRGEKVPVVTFLQGIQGIGKSMFTSFLQQYVVGYDATSNNPDIAALTGTFNGALCGKMLAIYDDPNVSGADQWRAFSNAIKNMSTSRTLTIRRLYKESFEEDNRICVMIDANDSPIMIGACDRRIFMPDLITARPADAPAYFARLGAALCTRGRSTAVLFARMLLVRRIDTYVPAVEPPMTKTKWRAIKQGLPRMAGFFREKLEAAELKGTRSMKIPSITAFALECKEHETSAGDRKPSTRDQVFTAMSTLGFIKTPAANGHKTVSAKIKVSKLRKAMEARQWISSEFERSVEHSDDEYSYSETEPDVVSKAPSVAGPCQP